MTRRRDIIDMTGQRYGRLTVRELVSNVKGTRGAKWVCDCDCGNSTVARRSHLLDGTKRSCGCLQRETRRENVKHAIAAAYRPGPTVILPRMTREQRLIYEKLRYRQARLPRDVAIREAMR